MQDWKPTVNTPESPARQACSQGPQNKHKSPGFGPMHSKHSEIVAIKTTENKVRRKPKQQKVRKSHEKLAFTLLQLNFCKKKKLQSLSKENVRCNLTHIHCHIKGQ